MSSGKRRILGLACLAGAWVSQAGCGYVNGANGGTDDDGDPPQNALMVIRDHFSHGVFYECVYDKNANLIQVYSYTLAGYVKDPAAPANACPNDPGEILNSSEYVPVQQNRSKASGTVKATTGSSATILYVTQRFTNTVAAFDSSTGAQLNLATLNGTPCGLALSPDGRTLFATVSAPYSQPNLPNYVAMIDTTTFQITNIALPAMSFPDYVAVSPDGSAVYVSAEGFYTGAEDQVVAPSALFIIDPVQRAVVQTLTLPHQFSQGNTDGRIAVSPDGTTLVVEDNSSLLVIDTLKLTISKSIDLNYLAQFPAPHMAFSPEGAFLYVRALVYTGTPFNGGQPVAVFDAQTWTVANVFSIGTSPQSTRIGDLALSLDGSTLCVTNTDDGSTSFYNASTGQLITSIPGDGQPKESMLLTAGN